MRDELRRWGKYVSILSLSAAAASCASTRPASQNGRLPASESSAFDRALAALGLNSYRANLHSHHYMQSEVRRSGRSRNPAPEGEPESEANLTFPHDDGRPSRNNEQGQNTYLAPAFSGHPTDYFRMACEYGKAHGELDILFVTPHTKNGEETGEADTGREGLAERHAMLASIGRDLGSDYYCGLGQEASSISSGNHINALGQFPRAQANGTDPFFFPSGAFDAFYPQVKQRTLAGETVVLQLNHPEVRGDLWWGDLGRASNKQFKGKLNDYGLDDFPPVGCAVTKKLKKPQPAGCAGSEPGEISHETLRSTYSAIRQAAGDRIRLIEIVSPAGATTNPGTDFKRVHDRIGPTGEPTEKASRVPQGLYDYVFYLNMGFQLGPTANQDNHHMNWGSAVASRTGVLAPSLQEKDVLSALDSRRTFATEDRNARVLLASGSAAMGAEILMTEGSEAVIRLGYDDPDSHDSKALVRLFYYREGEELDFHFRAEPLQAMRWMRFDAERTFAPTAAPSGYLPKEGDSDVITLTAGGTQEVRIPVQHGLQYVFAEFTQASDQDKIWTAPIWIRR